MVPVLIDTLLLWSIGLWWYIVGTAGYTIHRACTWLLIEMDIIMSYRNFSPELFLWTCHCYELLFYRTHTHTRTRAQVLYNKTTIVYVIVDGARRHKLHEIMCLTVSDFDAGLRSRLRPFFFSNSYLGHAFISYLRARNTYIHIYAFIVHHTYHIRVRTVCV